MVKAPVAGRVKTRLGKDIGMPEAAWWFRHQSRGLLRRLTDPRWSMVLSVSPDTAVDCRAWPAQIPRFPQGRGDLGARMVRSLARVRGPAVLIGGDIPGVEKTHIHNAFRALGDHASVIGPAEDGGFWLVGVKHPSRRVCGMFQSVEWSAPSTLAMTLPTLPGPVAQIGTLADVDDAADLLSWNRRRKQRDGIGSPW